MGRGDLLLHPAFGESIGPFFEQVEREGWQFFGASCRDFTCKAHSIEGNQQAD
jgi:hypothetical protein